MALLRSTHNPHSKIDQTSPKSLPNDNNHQTSSYSSSSNQKLFITSISIISFSLILLIISFRPSSFGTTPVDSSRHAVLDDLDSNSSHGEAWLGTHFLSMVRNNLMESTTTPKVKINTKIGFVNMDKTERESYEGLSMVETLVVDFPRVSPTITWEDLFPMRVEENPPLGTNTCPDIPMPRLNEPWHRDLDVVVARVPCGRASNASEGIRDVFRLQVNLVVANLVVARNEDREVFVVFVGPCGPMPEIFRCDDMLTHVGDYWVYKPDVARLRQKVSMPVGSCQIAPPFGHGGKEAARSSLGDEPKPSYAYVTVLHSSNAYVCGAIALAQSIKLTNSTHDLVLLHDSSISPSSLTGLRSAGWSTRPIQPIRSTFAEKGSYNEWNYSKLRIWQLTDYHKVAFIDSDLLVLRNMDKIFSYPQLSASPNNKVIFNSGIMVIEPSNCTFKHLMARAPHVVSYNGGDQGFLNEMFAWWHRLPRRINWLKMDMGRDSIEGVYGLHFLGLKPWMCYRDYDCNWDMVDMNMFASDVAHGKWWEVYDVMPEGLKKYCGLSRKMDGRIRKWRKIARRGRLRNRRWRIRVTDPRKDHLVG